MGFLLLAFLIFSGAFVAAGYMAWSVPERRTSAVLSARLREVRAHAGARPRVAADLVRREQRGIFAFLSDFVSWIGVLRRLQEYIDQADLKHRAVDVFTLSVLIAVVMYFLLGLVAPALILRIVLTLTLGSVPIVYIRQVRARRLHRFVQNFPDAIDLFNRSIKAGHNIHTSLETIAQETFDPVRMEFKNVIEELALGSPLEAALHNLGRRVPLIDLKFFIIGLILQRQTGANMVVVLENLALLIRERLNLAAKLNASTAQQRFSAVLLCAMPLVVGLGFWILKPEYIQLLYTDPTGSKFLTYAVISEIIGILVIRKIASPRF